MGRTMISYCSKMQSPAKDRVVFENAVAREGSCVVRMCSLRRITDCGGLKTARQNNPELVFVAVPMVFQCLFTEETKQLGLYIIMYDVISCMT